MCLIDAAVAARTAVHRAASVQVGLDRQPGIQALGHATDADGDLVVAVSDRQVAVFAPLVPTRLGDPVPGVAVATDLAPVAVAERIRRTVTLRGPLVALRGTDRTAACRLIRGREVGGDPLVWDADAHVLRLEPTSVTTTAHCRCVDASVRTTEQPIDASAYLKAEPDALADVESEWLGHLAVDHASELKSLAMHAAPWLDRVSLEVCPVALDQSGVRLRVRTSTLCRDLAVPFEHPVACACEANRAINALFADAVTAIS